MTRRSERSEERSHLTVRARRVLWQFPISHYCEKARWHLEHKGLDYEVRDVVPGLHLLVVPRAKNVRHRTVPVLDDEGTILGDSTDIALHLEEKYPEKPLIPRDPSARARTLELEAFFDDEVGPHVRRFVYGALMREPGGAAKAMFGSYPAHVRALRPLLGPFFERAVKRAYAIDARGVESSRRKLIAGFDRLEREIDGDPDRFLVGDALTLADVTAAAILGGLLATRGSPYEAMQMPDEVRELAASLEGRSCARWIENRYLRDRR